MNQNREEVSRKWKPRLVVMSINTMTLVERKLAWGQA
jgi:hypothetical protein